MSVDEREFGAGGDRGASVRGVSGSEAEGGIGASVRGVSGSLAELPSPCFVLDERALECNLAIIDAVREAANAGSGSGSGSGSGLDGADDAVELSGPRSVQYEGQGVEIIVALKACAMWSIFPRLAAHSDGATASSLSEARLVVEEFGPRAEFPLLAKEGWSKAGVVNTPPVRDEGLALGSGKGGPLSLSKSAREEFGVGSGKGARGQLAHTYAPVYTDADFDEIAACSSHITFNSVAQFERFRQRAPGGVSCGLRVNPGYSPVETDLYNPALPGSRLGIERLDELPEGVEGLHFHVLCESGAEHLARALSALEARFGHLLDALDSDGVPRLRWLNCGGGHLMTREGYDVDLLIDTLRGFRARHPHLRLILEPGSAFTWRTGFLVSTVEDIVESGGVRTAMLDVSFACHLPDCLEMPYMPKVVGAVECAPGEGYRLGGNSCLAGDWLGDWSFVHDDGSPRELRVGDRVVFEDAIHYTMVKTTMFNGVRHPSIAILHSDGELEVVRRFGPEDFKSRMG